MATSSMLHVRVDEELKEQASQALSSMGLTVSDAVRILLTRVVNDQAFPLELKVPNPTTRLAMLEARQKLATGSAGFESAHELFNELEEKREQ